MILLKVHVGGLMPVNSVIFQVKAIHQLSAQYLITIQVILINK